MKTTKVLLWYWGRRGGGPRYTLELAKVLAHDPALETHLSLSRQSELWAETVTLGLPGLHVNTYTSRFSAVLATARLPQLGRALSQYLIEQQIQVVNCPMSHLWNPALLRVLKTLGVPYILTLHDATPHPGEGFGVRQWWLAQEIKAAAGIVTLTEHVRDRLVAVYGYPAAQVWTIPHGVFTYNTLTQTPRLYPLNRSLRLLFFGRILPYKGLSLLLEAWPQVQQQFPQVELTIIGQGDLRPYADSLGRLTGVQVQNRWIQEAEIGAIFQQADLVVLPYLEASQSGVVAIAMAGGIPVIATPVGGLQEQVRDRQTGLIAGEVSAAAIAAAILELVQNPPLYQHCSREALRIAREQLSWSAIGAEMSAVFQQLALPGK